MKRIIILLLLVFIVTSSSVSYADHIDSMKYYKEAWDHYINGELTESEKLLRRAIVSDPMNEHAHSLLGEVLYLKQDMEGAIKAYEESVKGTGPRNTDHIMRLKNIEKEEEVEGELSEEIVGQFQVLFSDEVKPFSISRVMVDLEEAYEEIGRDLNHFPKEPAIVVFYPAEDFYRLKELPEEVVGVYDGKIKLPVLPNKSDAKELKRILWHEYTHLVIHQISSGKCPRWLNEGIAQYEEARIRPVDLSTLKERLEEEKLIPLDDLFSFGAAPGSQEVDAGLFYQESYMVARFIRVRWGKNKLLEIVRQTQLDIDLYEIFNSVLKVDDDEFKKLWQIWLEDVNDLQEEE